MTTFAGIEPLRTPEEVAELLVHISPFTIRRLARHKKIAYTAGAHGKVLFSAANVQGLIDHLNTPAVTDVEPDEDESPFNLSSRSASRARKTA